MLYMYYVCTQCTVCCYHYKKPCSIYSTVYGVSMKPTFVLNK